MNLNPAYLFNQLATLEHAYSKAHLSITEKEIIRIIFGVAPKKNWEILIIVAENKGMEPRASYAKDLATELQKEKQS